jgi:hypothetical protein
MGSQVLPQADLHPLSEWDFLQSQLPFRQVSLGLHLADLCVNLP